MSTLPGNPHADEAPTMTDQAPSTEDVRLLNVLTVALADAAQEDDNNFIPFTKRTHYANAIMAHLEEHRAARDRAVKAAALREAAADGHRAFTEWVAQTPARNYLRGMSAVLTQDLHAMADRIEAGE